MTVMPMPASATTMSVSTAKYCFSIPTSMSTIGTMGRNSVCVRKNSFLPGDFADADRHDAGGAGSFDAGKIAAQPAKFRLIFVKFCCRLGSRRIGILGRDRARRRRRVGVLRFGGLGDRIIEPWCADVSSTSLIFHFQSFLAAMPRLVITVTVVIAVISVIVAVAMPISAAISTVPATAAPISAIPASIPALNALPGARAPSALLPA